MAKCSWLRELNLGNTLVKDIAAIVTNPLTDLDLSSTGVTRLDPLEQVITLEYLNIAHTAILDLRPLSNLPRLRTIYATGTSIRRIEMVPVSVQRIVVTGPLDAGSVAQFKVKNPNVLIIYRQEEPLPCE